MATLCVAPIKARVARITRLDTCGNPVTGAGSLVVTEGFVRVEASPEYEEGEEFIVKNANGGLCVNEKDPDELKRVGLTIDFCQVDPDAIVLITGERLLTTSATGTGVAFGEGALTSHFSLELWQPLAGAGACDPSGIVRYMYWAFPNVRNPRVGGLTFENGPLTFTIEASTDNAGPNWGDGPGTGTSWLPGALDTTEHFAFNVTSVAPPAAVCGAQALS